MLLGADGCVLLSCPCKFYNFFLRECKWEYNFDIAVNNFQIQTTESGKGANLLNTSLRWEINMEDFTTYYMPKVFISYYILNLSAAQSSLEKKSRYSSIHLDK